MSLSDACERCGDVETYKHLFWECVESRRVWRSFNEYMSDIGHVHRVDCYERVFTIDDSLCDCCLFVCCSFVNALEFSIFIGIGIEIEITSTLRTLSFKKIIKKKKKKNVLNNQ